jgi:hypothetical protein
VELRFAADAGNPLPERAWLPRDFMRWEENLEPAWRSFHNGEADSEQKVVALRRA